MTIAETPARKNMYLKIFSLFLLIALAACQTTKTGNTSNTSARQTYLRKASFPVGVAVSMNKLKNLPVYRDIVIREFSSITAENNMKMQYTQPQPGKFTFEDGD